MKPRQIYIFLIILMNFSRLNSKLFITKDDRNPMTEDSIKLVVTTSQSILLVDTKDGSYFRIHHGEGIYYGISTFNQKLYVASRNRQLDSPNKVQTELGQILVFDNTGKLCERLHAPFPLRDMHQIAWHEGKLYISCSFDNMVAIFDGTTWEKWFPLGSIWEKWFPLGTIWDKLIPFGYSYKRDINHFNSFFFKDNCIWILAHNLGFSELYAFSEVNRVLVQKMEMGICAHNIWFEDGQFFTCSSKESKVLSDKGRVIEIEGFLRGVAFAENFRYVGVSEIGDRKIREYSSAKLLMFDGNWQKQKEIILEGEGQIRDIYVLPVEFNFVI